MKEVIAQGWTRIVKRNRGPRPREWGEVKDFDKKILSIDKKRNRHQPQLIHTIVHEEIHAVFPEFDEREVIALTDVLEVGLTVDQKIQYLDLYGYDYVEEVNISAQQPLNEPALELGV